MRYYVGVSVLLAGLVSSVLFAQPSDEVMTRESRVLRAESVGIADPGPRTVTAPGYYALSLDGDLQLDGFVFKEGRAFMHNDGGASAANTALGIEALVSTTPGSPEPFLGIRNTAIGHSALRSNTTGDRNAAVGASSLAFNTTGYTNTATGFNSLHENTTGAENTAFGSYALEGNTTGDRNTAFGAFALMYNVTGYWNTAHGVLSLVQNRTGSRNTALGYAAGSSIKAGTDNILIGSRGGGESNTLRIGRDTGTGDFELSRAFVSGIRNAVLSGNEQDVCVDDNDQLGPCSLSSGRFKENVRSMEDASSGVLDLRPVLFRYRPEVKSGTLEQFGLIAEEVARVYPTLVTSDEKGRPLSVRYDLLAPLLLNELQKQHRRLQVQSYVIGAMLLTGFAWLAGRRRAKRH